jgi:hypothetical protein
MSYDNPDNGEVLKSAFETMHRRPETIDASIRIAQQNPIVRRHRLESQPATPQTEQVAPTYANFGRNAVEQVDTTNRLTSAHEDLERIYGDQEAV